MERSFKRIKRRGGPRYGTASLFGAPTFQRQNPGGRYPAARRAAVMGRLRGAAAAGTYRRVGYYRPVGSNQELKFHDVDLDDALISSGGTVTDSICKIAQGVTEVQRIGRKAVIKKIGWRYQLSIAEQDAQSTPVSADTVRVILYQDMQCNGASAAFNDLLESTDFQSFSNLVNRGRFRVLMDRTHALSVRTLASDGAGVVSSSGIKQNYSFYKACNIPIEFNAATGAITEIRSNNIGVLVVSNAGVVNMDSKFRLRFTD